MLESEEKNKSYVLNNNGTKQKIENIINEFGNLTKVNDLPNEIIKYSNLRHYDTSTFSNTGDFVKNPIQESFSIIWNQDNFSEEFCISIYKVSEKVTNYVEEGKWKNTIHSKTILFPEYIYSKPFTTKDVNSLGKLKNHPIEYLIENSNCLSINQIEIQLLNKINEIILEVKSNLNSEVNLYLSNINNKISEFDKDNSGILDIVIGSNDFMNMLKKHQSKIIEIDRTFIQKFIKISNLLNSKKENIQNLYNLIKENREKFNLNQLEEYSEILKEKSYSIELILFHSINMITSLVEDDMITFYEIYESFDKLNIFNSNIENELSQKLTNISDELVNLMNSIKNMEQSLIDEIGHLSYVTQIGFDDLNNSVNRELKSINSSINFNNLLTGIQTYQMYKINKNTKKLRE